MNKPTYVPHLSSIYSDLHKQDAKMGLHVEQILKKYFDSKILNFVTFQWIIILRSSSATLMLLTDVGDEMCWWKITDIMKKVANTMIRSPTSLICHHHKINNITLSPKSLWLILQLELCFWRQDFSWLWRGSKKGFRTLLWIKKGSLDLHLNNVWFVC